MDVTSDIILDGPPAGLGLVADLVNRRIDELFQFEAARWQEVDSELKVPFDALFGMVNSGGKRLRPAFCYFAFVGCGGDPSADLVIDAGAALELLHTFALIHDDIMDGSHTRRGATTVHRSFMEMHQSAKLKGESRRFGEGVGILIGDLAFVYADSLLEAAPLRTRKIFSELRLEVNVGQYLDILGTAKSMPSIELAEKVCIYKSGKYTVERPLHVGASLANCSDTILEQLSSFGMPLGEAFQLKDDLLGAFGDSDIIGKPVGDDLREGKPTSLVALTLDRAVGSQRDAFVDLFSRECHDEEDLAKMLEIIESTGAKESVEQRVDELVDRSIAALSRTDLDAVAKTQLGELAFFVASRSL